MVLQYLCNFEMVSKQGNSDGLKVTKSQDKKNPHTVLLYLTGVLEKTRLFHGNTKQITGAWWGHSKLWPRKGQEEIPSWVEMF